ncbi:MAG TPA: hypothetical protein VN540_00315 [Clostridia bacterium]|nr:hypothetical protein [Clostridia bacterium]
MKRRQIALRLILLFVCTAIPLMGGCERLDKINEIFSAPTLAPTAAPIPVPTPVATFAGETTATPFSVNPLYSFYHAFLEGSRASSDALSRALAQHNTAASLEISLALSAHFAALSDIGATVCRLFPADDGNGYSGTVEGAAQGSGTMSASDGGTYAFTFTYSDGTALAGAYAPDARVDFSIGEWMQSSAPASQPPDFSSPISPDGQASVDADRTCAIEKTAEGWTSTVEEDGVASSLTIAGDAVAFVYGAVRARLEGGTLTLESVVLTEATAAP